MNIRKRLGLHDLDKMNLHPLDAKGNSASFARSDVAEIAYKLDGDEDFSFITINSDDDEVRELANFLSLQNDLSGRDEELAELLMNVRDELKKDGSDSINT